MKTRFICLTTLAVALLVAGSAVAQSQDAVMTNDQLGVSWTRPDGWTAVEGNERAVFNIRDDESQSQIELIATQLMSPDVANVFYDTFHETLTQSNFQPTATTEQDIGAHHVKLTQYRFEYAGVVLRVVIFEFTHESTAYLVVGYIKDDEFDTHYASFEEAVRSITFRS
jgi:hypothetical protein